MKFKVGQVWADGDDSRETIMSIDLDAKYPIQTPIGEYTLEGCIRADGKVRRSDLTALISEPEEMLLEGTEDAKAGRLTELPDDLLANDEEPEEEKLLTLQEVVATLTMDQIVGVKGTDWSWYYHWGVVDECEVGLVINVDETPMPMTHSNLTERCFIIRDKSSLEEK